MNKNSRTVLIIAGAVLAVLLVVPAVIGLVTRSSYGYWGWGMMGPGMMYGFGGGWLMAIFMVLFWGLIIWGIIALVRYLGGNRGGRPEENSALEILNKRYARGDIGREEFEEKKKSLI